MYVFLSQGNNDPYSTIAKIKDSGNKFFKDENYTQANKKYKKALRYLDWYEFFFLKF